MVGETDPHLVLHRMEWCFPLGYCSLLVGMDQVTKITSLSVRQRQVLRKLRSHQPVDFLKLCDVAPYSLRTLALMETRRLIRMEGDGVWATQDGLYALGLAEEKAQLMRRFRYA